VEGAPAVSGGQPGLVGRPKPSVDVLGEEVWSVTPIKVTQTTGSPEIWHIHIDESLDPIVLLLSLEADQVHAPLPAVVPGIEPVPLGVPHAAVIILPGEPVQVPVEPLHTALVNSVFAEETVGEAEFASALVGVSAAVTREQFLFAGCLWRHCAIVLKPPAIEEVGHRGEQVPNSVEELGIGSQRPEDQEDGHGCEPHGAGVALVSLD